MLYCVLVWMMVAVDAVLCVGMDDGGCGCCTVCWYG